MFEGSKAIDEKATLFSRAFDDLLRELVKATSERLIEVTEDFAGDETNFNEAIYIEGPDGDHSLIVVEEEIVDYLRANPIIVDAMKSSREFENEADDDLFKAARAIVNESLRFTEDEWEVKYPTDKQARFSR